MVLKNIRTIHDLVAWLEGQPKILKAARQYNKEQSTRAIGEWFLACAQAECWSELRTKDHAGVILDGITPLANNDEVAAEYLSAYFEEYDWSVEDGEPDEDLLMEGTQALKEALERHFNITL